MIGTKPLGFCFKHFQLCFGLMSYMTFDAKVMPEKIRNQIQLNLNYQEGNNVMNNTKSWLFQK